MKSLLRMIKTKGKTNFDEMHFTMLFVSPPLSHTHCRE